ncbi:MAG: type II toxin-antitoxin system RelE/ParE family toxin, partial [Actinomycetes bacterium]
RHFNLSILRKKVFYPPYSKSNLQYLSFYTIMWYSGIMIVSFGNKLAKEIWEKNSAKAVPKELWIRSKALLTIMHNTSTIDDLKIKGQPPNIRLHKLKGDRKDEWSVTIQLPWAITFKFKNGEFSEVKIENYHKG